MDIETLREKIEQLPPLSDSPERFTWEFRRKNLRHRILKHEVEKFLRWPIIKETMFVGNVPYVYDKYRELLGQDFAGDLSRWATAIVEPKFGGAELLPDIIIETSGNLVNQAHHLMTWENTTGERVEDLNFIFEFGGGYGAMALICRRLGFTGKYTILDLPEFSLLQQYYLSNVLPEDDKLFFIDDVEWVGIQRSLTIAKYDLLIANCSLSEVMGEDRDKFISWLWSKGGLITYHPRWDGFDNDTYFKEQYPQARFFNSKHHGNVRFCIW